MPRMVLERQFAGPLQDTLIQRWRDPTDGTICYIYLPITAPHSSPTQSGYVQYGPQHRLDQLFAPLWFGEQQHEGCASLNPAADTDCTAAGEIRFDAAIYADTLHHRL